MRARDEGALNGYAGQYDAKQARFRWSVVHPPTGSVDDAHIAVTLYATYVVDAMSSLESIAHLRSPTAKLTAAVSAAILALAQGQIEVERRRDWATRAGRCEAQRRDGDLTAHHLHQFRHADMPGLIVDAGESYPGGPLGEGLGSFRWTVGARRGQRLRYLGLDVPNPRHALAEAGCHRPHEVRPYSPGGMCKRIPWRGSSSAREECGLTGMKEGCGEASAALQVPWTTSRLLVLSP